MNDTKRQYLPGPPGLWVVATPLGHLGDLTDRAKLALEKADAILCEDTRRTAKLTSALGITPRLERFDEHSTPAKIRSTIEKLLSGQTFALVSDAGTPAISDPGARLVAAAHEAGIIVTPVPGPSAVTALLSVAGFGETAFVFRGFFPRASKEREVEIQEAASSSSAQVYVWFESPERIQASLQAFDEAFALSPSQPRLVVGKELTKIHEKIFTGDPRSVLDQVSAEIESERALGEWCLAAFFYTKKDENKLSKSVEMGFEKAWGLALECMISAQVPASEAARQVSQRFGVSRKLVYGEALRLSGKK